jgi:hypothetical protein
MDIRTAKLALSFMHQLILCDQYRLWSPASGASMSIMDVRVKRTRKSGIKSHQIPVQPPESLDIKVSDLVFALHTIPTLFLQPKLPT